MRIIEQSYVYLPPKTSLCRVVRDVRHGLLVAPEVDGGAAEGVVSW